MNHTWFFPFASILMTFLGLISCQPFDYPTANLSTTWINSDSNITHSVNFTDGSKVRSILLRGSFGPRYACGFYCNGNCDTYLFAIFIVQTNSVSGITSPSIGFPPVVWSANGNKPVKLNATLEITSEGSLVLKDVDGSLAWSTNTSHKSVVGLNLTEMGNLVLFDKNNSIVWQSFDHPTDSLVPGQSLVSGQKLVSTISDTNRSRGLYSLSVNSEGLIAFIESNPPQEYYRFGVSYADENVRYVKFQNGSLDLFIPSANHSNRPVRSITFSQASSAQYMRLQPDGHLNVYDYESSTGWKDVADLSTGYLGECNYPMVCGKNGICSKGQCSCPGSVTDSTNYFRPINEMQPDLGCSAVTPLNCNASDHHSFVELKNVTYFTFSSDINDTDVDQCREACLRNCSCKAALFRYGSNSSSGDCYLAPEIFSLMRNEEDKTHYKASAMVKVQIAPPIIAASPGPSTASITKRKSSNRPAIFGIGIGVFFLSVVIIGVTIFFIRKKRSADKDEEGYLDHIPGMPCRFSHEDLKIATENFNKKLGEGGFGSVFEGALKDGTRIAVKCLDGIGQVKKSFLAEVETIGSIHHVNLVRLIGFCAEKSHRLLVYEYMTNGSLDRWIYPGSQNVFLDWKSRRKIIQDVSKGLAYLHEDCRQKIIHLDIKPQNILLDENYNAKLSDFGLSKLIERDQIEVVTTMRGTPGYLAPEWLSAVITEKVDVYSFGIVVLEILCGRKNFELSEPEEYRHLLSLFKMKAEEGRLSDLIDKGNEDMQSHETKVVDMMKVAAWCLQSDHAKRPPMSVVVKVLEGVMDVEKNLDYSSLNSRTTPMAKAPENFYADATPLLPSILSGPR